MRHRVRDRIGIHPTRQRPRIQPPFLVLRELGPHAGDAFLAGGALRDDAVGVDPSDEAVEEAGILLFLFLLVADGMRSFLRSVVISHDDEIGGAV